MFGVVALNVLKVPPIFIDSEVNVNADVYIKILQDHIRPWIFSNFDPDAKIKYQQLGALPNTARKIQEGSEKHTGFWEKVYGHHAPQI